MFEMLIIVSIFEIKDLFWIYFSIFINNLQKELHNIPKLRFLMSCFQITYPFSSYTIFKTFLHKITRNSFFIPKIIFNILLHLYKRCKLQKLVIIVLIKSRLSYINYNLNRTTLFMFLFDLCKIFYRICNM